MKWNFEKEIEKEFVLVSIDANIAHRTVRSRTLEDVHDNVSLFLLLAFFFLILYITNKQTKQTNTHTHRFYSKAKTHTQWRKTKNSFLTRTRATCTFFFIVVFTREWLKQKKFETFSKNEEFLYLICFIQIHIFIIAHNTSLSTTTYVRCTCWCFLKKSVQWIRLQSKAKRDVLF